MMAQIPEGYEPMVDVDRTLNALKMTESMGDYGEKGGSGEFGAYQFMPGTWRQWSKEFMLENHGFPGILPLSPENQEDVARWRVQKWAAEGYGPEQIASMWNSGSPNWQGKRGVNQYGQKYDTEHYVKLFSGYYQRAGIPEGFEAVQPQTDFPEGYEPVEEGGAPGLNVIRKPIPGTEQPGWLQRSLDAIRNALPLIEEAGAAEIPEQQTVNPPTIDLSGGRPTITITPPAGGQFDEASLYRPTTKGAPAGVEIPEGYEPIPYTPEQEPECIPYQSPSQQLYQTFLAPPEPGQEPPIASREWFTQTVPKSFNRAALGVLTFPYDAVKSMTDPVFNQLDRSGPFSPSELAVDEANAIWDNISGFAEFSGAPIGVYGWKKFKQVWQNDPGAAVLGVASLISPLLKQRGIKASEEQMAGLARRALEEDNPQVQSYVDQVTNPLLSQAGAVTTEPLRAAVTFGQKIHDAVTVDPVPKMTRVDSRIADAAVEHASARIAVPHMVDDLLAKVFPDSYNDPARMSKTIDILNKDNVLAGWDAFRQRTVDALAAAKRESDPAKKKELLKEADAWDDDSHAIAREHDVDAYRKEIGDLIASNDPAAREIVSNIERWKEHVNPLLDQLYNEKKRVDPATPREERGAFFGARINLTSVDRAAELGQMLNNADSPMPGPTVGGNYRNPNVKHDQFMRRATFTGQYSNDARLNLMNVLGPRWGEVTKIRLYDQLVKSGAAIYAEPGAKMPEKIQGQDVVRFPIKQSVTGVDGITREIETALFVRKDLARELRRVLATDMPIGSNPILRALTNVQLMQIADAVTHSKNLLSVVTRAQGAGSIWKDIVRKFPALGTGDALVRIGKVWREVVADTPAIRTELADMARQGLIRPEYPATGLQKVTHGQQFLHAVDTAARIIMNRFFDNLVERDLVNDTPTNRRNYINQVGQYNSRLQGPVMNAFKQVGLSPFIVAGRNFNRQGIRGIAGAPGVTASTAGSALQMRMLNIAGSTVGAISFVAMLNTLTTGKPGGRPGTPAGAWDLGTAEDEKGRHRVIDLLQLTGVRRGMRITGVEALAEGLKAGHTPEQIAGKIIEESGQAALHPWMGPAPAFAVKTLTGKQPDLRGMMEAQKIPGAGPYEPAQLKENFRAALESQNPLIYSMVRPVLQKLGWDNKPESPLGQGAVANALKPYLGTGVANFVDTFLKSPAGAAGVRDVYPSRSAALEMAITFAHQKAPVGKTVREEEAGIARRQIEKLIRQGKTLPPELRLQAQEQFSESQIRRIGKIGKMTDLQSAVMPRTAIESMMILNVATPEEVVEIYPIVERKVRTTIKGASPVVKEELERLLAEFRFKHQALLKR